MRTNKLMVCTMEYFEKNTNGFWLDTLEGLLERFPELELPHKQDFYTLLFIDSAKGEIIIDKVKIDTDQAKLIIIKPDCVSSITLDKYAKGSIINFTSDFFDLRYNTNLLYQFSFLKKWEKPFVRLTEKQVYKWNSLLLLVKKEYQNCSKGFRNVLCSYLNILLFEFERAYNPVRTIEQNHSRESKIIYFKQLIDKHYKSKKTPSQYANLLHVSANHLNKVCKKETGKTAGSLIRQRILLESQRLLQYTNLTVNEIALEMGFDTPSYFITFFKKQYGCTPEVFRKRQNDLFYFV
ncbi:helix-turn-helix domain-containing protein [Aquimarina hainanensis]